MAEFDVSDAKRQLIAMGQRRDATTSRRRPSRRRPLRRSPDEPDALGAFATREEAARRGLGSRPGGWTPFGDEPEIITLDKPFMILDLRDRTQGVNIIVADSVEPMNSWAKVDSWLNKPDDFLTYDEVGFYFYWPNDTGKTPPSMSRRCSTFTAVAMPPPTTAGFGLPFGMWETLA